MKAAPIGGGDILVEQSGPTGVGGDTNAAAFLVLDVNPTTSSVVQSFVSTQFSSAGKMYTTTQQPLENLSLSDGGTEVSFAGWDSPGTASPLGTTQGIPRGVGTLDASGAGGMPASYNPAVLNPSPDQPHTAYSPDGVNWYFGDTDGMYYNNGTTPLAGSNGTIAIKGFGGNTYALHTIRPSIMPDQENTVGGDRISLVTPATPGTGSITYTTILTKETPGLVIHDFYMLSSGNNSVYDTMYVTTSSGVDKYALISGTWTAEGSAALAGASGIAAKELAGGGVSLFVSADGNSATLDELTDSAAFNATINASTPLVLYTAPTDDLLHGVSLAPVPEPASLVLAMLGGFALLALVRTHG
jgi:hypothetical protein